MENKCLIVKEGSHSVDSLIEEYLGSTKPKSIILRVLFMYACLLLMTPTLKSYFETRNYLKLLSIYPRILVGNILITAVFCLVLDGIAHF